MKNQFDVKAQSIGICDAIAGTLDTLEKKRNQFGSAQLEYQRVEMELGTMTRDKTIAFSQDPELAEAVDPKTGRTNQQWSQYLLEHKLEQDAEFADCLRRYYLAQEAQMQLQSDIAMLAEKLGGLKSQARLLASLMEFISDDELRPTDS